MTYGTYTFDPVPMLNYSMQIARTGDGKPLCKQYQGTLNGTLLYSTACGTGSLANVIQQINELDDAFGCETCRNLRIECDDGMGGNDIILDIYPRILSLEFSETPDNWTQTSTYNIQMEWNEPLPSGDNCEPVVSANESWNVQFGDSCLFTIAERPEPQAGVGEPTCPEEVGPIVLNVSHELSATGKCQCLDNGMGGVNLISGCENARTWVESRMGFDDTCLQFFGAENNLPTDEEYAVCNRKINKTKNVTNGEFSVTETWTVVFVPDATGLLGYKGLATEDFEVSLEISADSCDTQVSVSGTITGMEKITYTPRTPDGGGGFNPPDFTVDTTKIENAKSYWNTLQPLLYCRAQECSPCQLNVVPLGTNFSINHRTGTIRYTYIFNNRPQNFIDGAKSETITISDTIPSDVFTSAIIPGRVQGPLYQRINTVTEACRTVNIDVTMEQNCCTDPLNCPPDDPARDVCIDWAAFNAGRPDTQVEDFLCCLEQELTVAYDIVFKRSDTVNWNPRTCRYSRNVTWCYQVCN